MNQATLREQLKCAAIATLFTCILPWAAYTQTSRDSAASSRLQPFFDQVVRIIPTNADGSLAAQGFGLIVGNKDDQLYIATPRHLAFGMELPSSLSSKLRVEFHTIPHTSFAAKRLDVTSVRDDLAVIQLVRPEGLILPNATTAVISELPKNEPVWNIGFSQRWYISDRAGRLDALDEADGRTYVAGLQTPPGASGGASVTLLGLIGMVLEDTKDHSAVLLADRIGADFESWSLPVNLLTPLPPSAYPGADTTALPSITKPSGFCNDLKKVVDSAHREFVDLTGPQIYDGVLRSKIRLKGWHDCAVHDARPTADWFECELGPFNSKEEAMRMFREIASDVEKSCLNTGWSVTGNPEADISFRLKGSAPTIELEARNQLIGDNWGVTISVSAFSN